MKLYNDSSCHMLTVNHFSDRNIKKNLLKAFVKVCMTEDLTTLKEKDLPSKKVN